MLDHLTYGLAALVSTVLVGIAIARASGARRWALLLVPLVAWGVYGRRLLDLHQHEQRIVCRLADGVTVIDDGGVLPDCDSVADTIRLTLGLWQAVPGEHQSLHGLEVWVKPRPFRRNGVEVVEYAKPFGRSIAVGMAGDARDMRALAHGLGHVLCACDEAALRSIAEQYEVPY